jgi:hypothetical protein
MDNKPGLSAPLPESEVHTLAASRASLSDDGKVSAAGEQTDVEVGSQTEKRDQQHDEKHDALARQATAMSKTGKPLEQTATREDGTEYPTGMTLSLIVLALCLSVFTMALGTPPPRHQAWESRANNMARQLHHRDRHPQNHRPVPVSA